MDRELTGKKIVIFAGVTGTGKATAIVCSREGADIVTVSRAKADDDRVVTTKEACEEAGCASYHHLTCDVMDKDAVFETVRKAAEILGGRIDGLSLGQGTDHITPTIDLTTEQLEWDMKVAYLGSVYAAQAAYPYMRGHKSSIILYGASAFSLGNRQFAAYNASKGAVIGFGRTIANEWSADNIRTNIVGPVVYTEISDEFLKVCTPEQMAESRRTLDAIPLGGPELKSWDRMGKASTVGELNAFLFSDRADFINGQYINVDGGVNQGRV